MQAGEALSSWRGHIYTFMCYVLLLIFGVMVEKCKHCNPAWLHCRWLAWPAWPCRTNKNMCQIWQMIYMYLLLLLLHRVSESCLPAHNARCTANCTWPTARGPWYAIKHKPWPWQRAQWSASGNRPWQEFEKAAPKTDWGFRKTPGKPQKTPRIVVGFRGQFLGVFWGSLDRLWGAIGVIWPVQFGSKGSLWDALGPPLATTMYYLELRALWG